MWESTAKLIKQTYTVDEAGNSVAVRTERVVFVKPRSVSRSEFYQAAQAGLQPSVVLVLSFSTDYEGEKVVEWEGREYSVTRTYHRPDRDSLELTLEERTENGV